MKHLWEVSMGYTDEDGDFWKNWRSVNVIAESANQAIKKAKFRKHEELTGLRIVGSEDENNEG